MEYKLIPLDLGNTELDDKSKFTYFKNFGQKLNFTFISWLIVGGGKKVLVDSGPGDPEWARTVRGLQLKPGAHGDIASALRVAGAEPGEIDVVVCTHLHWDHCFNHRLFPRAKFLVQERELIHAMDPIPAQRPTYGWAENQLAPFLWIADKYKAIKGDREILPGISLLLTPGHTPGTQGVLVTTSAGKFFLASDTVPLYENWETRTPNGIHVNLLEYRDSIERIEGLEGAVILPGHDARVLERSVYP